MSYIFIFFKKQTWHGTIKEQKDRVLNGVIPDGTWVGIPFGEMKLDSQNNSNMTSKSLARKMGGDWEKVDAQATSSEGAGGECAMLLLFWEQRYKWMV